MSDARVRSFSLRRGLQVSPLVARSTQSQGSGAAGHGGAYAGPGGGQGAGQQLKGYGAA